jgi:hypothetical protein
MLNFYNLRYSCCVFKIKFFIEDVVFPQLDDNVRDLLINELGSIYKQSALCWVANQNFDKFLDATSKILDCVLGTCDRHMPANERW